MLSPYCDGFRLNEPSLFGRIMKCGRLDYLRHHVAHGGFYRDHFSMASSRILMSAV